MKSTRVGNIQCKKEAIFHWENRGRMLANMLYSLNYPDAKAMKKILQGEIVTAQWSSETPMQYCFPKH